MWIPSLRYSKVTMFFSQICDPYLNMFSKLRFMHVGMLDFSPIIAFALLSALAQIFNQLAATGKFSVAYIIAILLSFIWDIFASILILLIIILVIRLIVLLAKKDSASFWTSIDNLVFKIASPITRTFAKNKFVNMTWQVIIALIFSILIYVAGKVIIYYLFKLIMMIPF